MIHTEEGKVGVNFSIKKRKGDTWEHIDLAAFAGQTLGEMFRGFEGKDVVAELVIAADRFYFCGTAFWLERMQRKGKAATFLQAVEIMRTRCPDLLEKKIPGIQEIADIFPEPDMIMEACTIENMTSKNGV